ncbi:tyrosine-type recombinase/integrase [Gammaproteobacteria bacterium]|nr:tyrosine-type recombinase/integrase [Gammaproteobacteria bacterium]
MPPKPRLDANKGLPAGWRHKHGAYYYRPPIQQRDLWDGKTEYRLGKTLSEAYRAWANKLELYSDATVMWELLDRYALEIIPLKAPKTQLSNQASIRKLKSVFGEMPIEAVKPKHVYKFKDLRGQQGKTAANRDIEVLSHAFTKVIEWGLCEVHPIKGKVQKFSRPPRKRYIEDWELAEALKVASPFIHSYIQLKLLTGLRRGDLLALKLPDLKDDGIHITPRKTANTTGKKMIFVWTDSLHGAVDIIVNNRKKVLSIWLFHTNKGQPYIKNDGTANGFDSIWQRFMAKALKNTDLQERFTEHDLRAKVASEAESEHAKQMLGHSSSEITNRVYRRKPELIRPAK